MSLTDEQLMMQFCQGSRPALHDLFGRYSDKLYRFVYGAYLHNRQQAEDCVQEVFLRLIRKKASYQEGRKFSTWLYTIARNAALNMVRDHSRRAQWLEFDPRQHIAPTKSAGEWATAQELHKLVQKTVQELPTNLREVFVLREIDGFPYPEISTMLGMTEGNIRTSVHRAKKKLQEALRSYLED